MATVLSDEEWLGLYRRIIAILRQLELLDIVAEMEAAAARPVVAESSAEEDAWVFAISKEVSRTALRARTPAEAFAAAVDVLSARLSELPSVAHSVQARFEGKEIAFRNSEEDAYADRPSFSFTLDRATVTADEARMIDRELSVLREAAVAERSL